jgi:hypothetical protein
MEKGGGAAENRAVPSVRGSRDSLVHVAVINASVITQ